MLSAHPFAVLGFVAWLSCVLVLIKTAWSIKFYGPHRLRDALLLNVENDDRKKAQLYRGASIGAVLFLVGIVFHLLDMWLAP